MNKNPEWENSQYIETPTIHHFLIGIPHECLMCHRKIYSFHIMDIIYPSHAK